MKALSRESGITISISQQDRTDESLWKMKGLWLGRSQIQIKQKRNARYCDWLELELEPTSNKERGSSSSAIVLAEYVTENWI